MQGDDELTLGLWLSITELAHRKGVNKSAVSRRVARLQEDGLLNVRLSAGGTKLINIVEYDRATGAAGQGAPATGKPDAPTFRQAQTREKQYVAELRRIELMEKLGHVVPVKDMEQAIGQAAAVIIAVLERLPNEAGRLRAAGTKEGEHGIRAELKKIVHAQRKAIADALRPLAEQFKPSAPFPADAGATAAPSSQQETHG